MPQLALHLLTVHKILYCSSSMNTSRQLQGDFSVGEASPTAHVLCLYSFPGHSNTERVTMICGALPHTAFRIPFSTWQGYEGHSILAHCSPSHAARNYKGRTSNPCIYYEITTPSPSGPQHGGHCLRSIQPWEEAMERGRCQTIILERPLARSTPTLPNLMSSRWHQRTDGCLQLVKGCGCRRRHLLSDRKCFSKSSGRMPSSLQAAVASGRYLGFTSSLEWGGRRHSDILRFSSETTVKHQFYPCNCRTHTHAKSPIGTTNSQGTYAAKVR